MQAFSRYAIIYEVGLFSKRCLLKMNKCLVITISLLTLYMPVAIGEETTGGGHKPATSGTEATSKARKTDKAGKPPATGSRDFLRLAEPRVKKKKRPMVRPYGSYWTAAYGSKIVEEDSDEYVEEYVRPYFSPYAAVPAEPEKPKRLKLSPITPPPLSEFIEVDFSRFASGSYVSEYADKFVKMRCKFASLAPEGMRLEEFPAPDYVNFLVTGTGSTMFSLTVAAPREKASKIFGLESQKEIILYGRAVKLGLTGITLVVEEVEAK